jgi:uncharacterized membrane protein YbaN (DUF454 family)
VDGANGGTHLKKILRIAAGVGLILVGIVGLIMPVMPGWVFIIPGLMILAEYSKSARRLLDWLKAKFEDARTATGGKPSPK